jgi:valyl-tRNA synthetase
MYKLDYVISDFKKYSSTYRFDLMANSIYDFVWNEYCDWYLEIAKNNTSDTTKKFLIYSLIRILKICHPIIPFITEEIWSELSKNGFVSEDSLTNSSFPSQVRISKESDIDTRVTDIKEMIKKIRKTRTELGIHPKNKFKVEILINNKVLSQDILDNITLVNSLSGIELSIIKKEERESNDFIQLIHNKFSLYLYIKSMINIKDEIKKIGKNIIQLESVLKKIDSKLNNKSFIEKAPSEIINQNVSNRKKISNEILSLENLKSNLSD